MDPSPTSSTGAIAAIWNQFCQQKNHEPEYSASQDETSGQWKVKMSIRNYDGWSVGLGKTKADAKGSAQLYFLQRHHQSEWDRIVQGITDVQYSRQGEQLPFEEDMHTEFKGSFEVDTCMSFDDFRASFKDSAGKNICAFLNSDRPGGSLYYGVHDSGKVQGILVPRKQRDEIRLLLVPIFRRFDPPITNDQVWLEWKKVESPDTSDLLMVVVKIRSVLKSTFWYDHVVYERKNGSSVKMLPQKIRNRIKESLMASLGAINM